MLFFLLFFSFKKEKMLQIISVLCFYSFFFSLHVWFFCRIFERKDFVAFIKARVGGGGEIGLLYINVLSP